MESDVIYEFPFQLSRTMRVFLQCFSSQQTSKLDILQIGKGEQVSGSKDVILSLQSVFKDPILFLKSLSLLLFTISSWRD